MAGRPPKYSSEQERKAADAERKRKARTQDVDPELPVRDVTQESPAEELKVLAVSLDEYVASAKRMAAIYADEIGETDEPLRISEAIVIFNRRSDRLQRAEDYARWRYAGVLAGEVASL